jgi:iron complex outermembrane receptor protein
MRVKDSKTSRAALLSASVAAVLTPLVTQAQSAAPHVEEVVVTAQRREENLQDTPISIAAFGEEALNQRGMTNLRNITNYTPNVEITVTNRPTAGGSAYAAGFVASARAITLIPPIRASAYTSMVFTSPVRSAA